MSKVSEKAKLYGSFETFYQQYNSLSSSIHALPIDNNLKAKICLFMDTAFLWTKEAFLLINTKEKNKSDKPSETEEVSESVEDSSKTV